MTHPLTRGNTAPEVGLELHSLPRTHWTPPDMRNPARFEARSVDKVHIPKLPSSKHRSHQPHPYRRAHSRRSGQHTPEFRRPTRARRDGLD